jgi:steroid 5-alpha reductase family enzyme
MVIAWAARLGTYLFRRVHREGKDGRFDLLKRSPTTFLVTWTVQGLWTFVVALPVLIVLLRKAGPVSEFCALRETPLEHMVWIQWVGLAVWTAGFAIECVADGQKAAFRKDPENKGKWINVGLWAKAQHPNYFGEITLWTGLVMVGSPLYEGFEWLAVMSPLVTWVLLTRVSGVPMVRARNARKWGNDPAYQAYLKEVPMLIPLGRRSR